MSQYALYKIMHYAVRTLSLTIVVVLSACDSDTSIMGSVGNGSGKYFAGLVANGTAGRTILSLDNSEVRGILSVSVADELDSRWGGNFHHTALNAIAADATGNPVGISSAFVDGIALSQQGVSTNIFVEDAAHDNIIAGQNAQWNVTLADGTTFNDNILIPVTPTITNLVDYQSYDKNSGLTIQWNDGGDLDAEAIISLGVDPTLTREEGGDVSQLNRAALPTLVYTEATNDNGSFTIPASDLSAFPSNVFVNVCVTTFNYQTKARSDGELYGLVARSAYSIPIKLTSSN